jgi:iron complex transport system permease protein
MKTRWFWIILALATPLVIWFCLIMGSTSFGFPDTATFSGKAILDLRISRVLCGLIVGAALSCAGVVFQAVLRNPLAEPYILGVSSGAGLGAAIAILTGLSTFSGFALPGAAFVAAALTLWLVFVLASDGQHAPSVYSLILSGVIISSIASSILMFMVSTASLEGVHSVLWWLLGNLQPASPHILQATGSVVVAGGIILWLMSRELNALTLGREMAHHLGIRSQLVITLALAMATLITAAAVGIAGLIGFVGLIVPHVVRHLVGPDHRRLIPASAIAGGLFLALCDAIARRVMAPIEIPVGVVTAICGGPFFLIILRLKRKQGWVAS